MNDITRALLAGLHERYEVIRDRLPLAIGIHQQLLAEGHDPALLRRVLFIHIKSIKYLRKMAKGGVRHNLDGSESGSIDPEHVEFARQQLEEFDQLNAARLLRKKEQKAQITAKLARAAIPKEPAKTAAKAPPTVKVAAKPAPKTPPTALSAVTIVVKKKRVPQVPK